MTLHSRPNTRKWKNCSRQRTLQVSVPSLTMTSGIVCERPTTHRSNTSSGWPRLLRTVGLAMMMCGRLPSPVSSNVRLRPFGWFWGTVSTDASKIALYACTGHNLVNCIVSSAQNLRTTNTHIHTHTHTHFKWSFSMWTWLSCFHFL